MNIGESTNRLQRVERLPPKQTPSQNRHSTNIPKAVICGRGKTETRDSLLSGNSRHISENIGNQIRLLRIGAFVAHIVLVVTTHFHSKRHSDSEFLIVHLYNAPILHRPNQKSEKEQKCFETISFVHKSII